jgi:hypothetical protein
LLLKNMSTSVFADMQCRKGQKAVALRPAASGGLSSYDAV